MMKRLPVFAARLGLLGTLLCGPVLSQSRAAQERPLVAAAGSADELARRFLAAVRANDLDAVLELAITREEFDRYVWPELPAPTRGLPADFVWDTAYNRGQAKIHGAMAALGGRQLTLKELTFTGEIEEYPTFRLYRDSLLHLVDENGKLQVIRLFGSVIELDGQFKIYSFNYKD